MTLLCLPILTEKGQKQVTEKGEMALSLKSSAEGGGHKYFVFVQ